MKILIGADFVPTKRNSGDFSNCNLRGLIGKGLCDVFSNADYRIFNLEMPLTDKATPIFKCGPNLCAPTSTIAGYVSAKIDLLSLANNHIMDHGNMGLLSTLKILDENKIHHVGAGMNLLCAQKPFLIDAPQKVAVYACAEQEFSVTRGDYPGANPYDPLESFDEVEKLHKKVDYIIVLYHGGKEEYRYPSPMLQKRCRKFIDKGANLVICQHSHCIGCCEKYGNGEIVYGQGNALFDLEDNEFWNTGLLVLCDTNDRSIEYIPIEKKGSGVRLAESGADILRAFYSRSSQIQDAEFVSKEYTRFAQEYKGQYYKSLIGVGDWLPYRIVNRLMGHKLDKFVGEKCASKRQLLNWKNIIQCEAHNELLLEAIEDDICKRSGKT